MLPCFGLLHYGSMYQRHLAQFKRNLERVSHTWITQGVELLCFHIASHASVFLMFLYCPEFEGAALIVRTKQIIGFVFFNHNEDARNLAQRLNNFS